jgi:hypothetical protein
MDFVEASFADEMTYGASLLLIGVSFRRQPKGILFPLLERCTVPGETFVV